VYWYVLSVNSGTRAFAEVTFADLCDSAAVSAASAPSYLLAWEANSSAASVRVVSPAQSLPLRATDEFNFTFHTFAPVYSWMLGPGGSASPAITFAFLGEVDKWIAASEQRVHRVAYSSAGTRVHVRGGQGENVTLAFASIANPARTVQLTCTLGAGLSAAFTVSPTGAASCDKFSRPISA
jgi:hypothetical protein